MQILYAALLMLPVVLMRGRSRALWVLFVAPVLVLCAADVAVGNWCPALSDGERIGMIAIPAGLALLFGYPWLFRLALPSQPLENGTLLDELLANPIAGGLRPASVRIWKTGGRTANAAVCGIVRPLRYVFLSDGLLHCLTPRQVNAVFAHEMAHARAGHLSLRMAVMAAPLALIAMVWRIAPEVLNSPS
ncbi:MAG: M48 family metalloprotease, partial [Planctomycetales bacterium]|nr:M48 family metalloprotease [Planctomycetales bacterium]